MPLKLLQVFSWVQRWPDGARDKERALTGALMKCQQRIATITSMWGCFMAVEAWSLTQTAVIAHDAPARWLVAFSPASLWYMKHCLVMPDIWFLQLMKMFFPSQPSIGRLATFRQPWHNCVITVTDSFLGEFWLVLSHCPNEGHKLEFSWWALSYMLSHVSAHVGF